MRVSVCACECACVCGFICIFFQLEKEENSPFIYRIALKLIIKWWKFIELIIEKKIQVCVQILQVYMYVDNEDTYMHIEREKNWSMKIGMQKNNNREKNGNPTTNSDIAL